MPLPRFTLSVGRSNKGAVTSDRAGINCGSACSAKFAQGSVVTVTKDTSVQANFSKSFHRDRGWCVAVIP